MLRTFKIDVPVLVSRLGFPNNTIPKMFVFDGEMDVPCDRFYKRGPNYMNDWRDYTIVHVERKMRVVVVDGTNGRGGKPRVFVQCPSCGKLVPAGRLHQHVGARTTCNRVDSFHVGARVRMTLTDSSETVTIIGERHGLERGWVYPIRDSQGHETEISEVFLHAI